MRILLLEGEPGDGTAVTAELVDAGHEVARCHEVGSLGFDCEGMAHGSGCPLESGPVDAAVVVRSAPSERPTAFEGGARCALRRHVPLVLSGDHRRSPYRPWAQAEAGDDVAGAVERAAAQPLEAHSAAAEGALRDVLDVHGLTDLGARAEVLARHGDLQVRLVASGPVPRSVAEIAAVRAAGAVRAVDPHPRTVDVRVEPVDG